MKGVIRFALGLANMPDATVNDLDKALPGMARLATVAKDLEPDLREAEPHIEALLPIFDRVLPKLKAAYPDLIAVIPTVEELINFTKGE